jgi:hypothetical protein
MSNRECDTSFRNLSFGKQPALNINCGQLNLTAAKLTSHDPVGVPPTGSIFVHLPEVRLPPQVDCCRHSSVQFVHVATVKCSSTLFGNTFPGNNPPGYTRNGVNVTYEPDKERQ